ncbi:unnamed protein product [Owenia fusiformis]|uniref:Uncharacterized protein n=1 Tax=Owenia fusiformis TaxID=6347 RepID=A0A8J1UT27_OWEFU|nr:unnamed protein product [Owenia fusiformis]
MELKDLSLTSTPKTKNYGLGKLQEKHTKSEINVNPSSKLKLDTQNKQLKDYEKMNRNITKRLTYEKTELSSVGATRSPSIVDPPNILQSKDEVMRLSDLDLHERLIKISKQVSSSPRIKQPKKDINSHDPNNNSNSLKNSKYSELDNVKENNGGTMPSARYKPYNDKIQSYKSKAITKSRSVVPEQSSTIDVTPSHITSSHITSPRVMSAPSITGILSVNKSLNASMNKKVTWKEPIEMQSVGILL